jgi:SAM-dependent methyltransferase
MRDTGERLIPDVIATHDRMTATLLEIHLERYALAAQRAAGGRVLDIACGSGYGSRLLHDRGVREVVGVDVDPEAIAFARTRYGAEGIQFQAAAAETFDGTGFDVIASFETIEHLHDPLAFLQRTHAMLAPRGMLMVSASTIVTSDFYRFHRHDFTHAGFRNLLLRAGYGIVSELPHALTFNLADLGTAFRLRPSGVPVSRVVRQPLHYASRLWRVLAQGGLEYRNVTLLCEPQ